MDIEADATQGQETDTGAEVDPQASTTDSSGGTNPVWEPLRQKLGDIGFESIKSDLANWDKSANERIAAVNKSYAPYKELEAQGYTPQQLAAAGQLAKQLDTDPAAVYEQLGQFLQQTGRMPSKQELADAVQEAETDDPEAPSEDPRLARIEQQQAQIAEFLRNQEQAQMQQNADREVDSEIKAFEAAHPEYSKDDVKEVLQRAAAKALANQNAGIDEFPTLEQANAEFVALRNRILSTPRAADSAPMLAPTSGGIPATGGQKSLGQLSNAETQDILANLVANVPR